MKQVIKKELDTFEIFNAVADNIDLHEDPKNFKADDEESGIHEESFFSEELDAQLEIVVSARELSVYVNDDEEPWHWDLDGNGLDWFWVGA